MVKSECKYAWEHSSVGSERLPYKQRVGGSTPSAPTMKALRNFRGAFFCVFVQHGLHPFQGQGENPVYYA